MDASIYAWAYAMIGLLFTVFWVVNEPNKINRRVGLGASVLWPLTLLVLILLFLWALTFGRHAAPSVDEGEGSDR